MKRRIMITDSHGAQIDSVMIEADDVPNANYSRPVRAVVQEQCNMGHWHETQSVAFTPWGES